MDRFLILDRNTGRVSSAADCSVIDITLPHVKAMAEYWSDPNVDTDDIAIRLHDLFGSDLSTILMQDPERKRET